MPTQKTTPIPGLTSIRFIAAFFVVIHHFSSGFFPSHLDSWLFKQLLRLSFIGVSLFFILSGYILTYVYLSRMDTPRIDKFSFWKARFARIYPLYFLSFMIQVPFAVDYLQLNNQPPET